MLSTTLFAKMTPSTSKRIRQNFHCANVYDKWCFRYDSRALFQCIFHAIYIHIHSVCWNIYFQSVLFRFVCLWGAMTAPLFHLPRGTFIGSRCVFKCKTVNKKKKHTHTLSYLTRDMLYIDYHRIETLYRCYICFAHLIVYFRFFFSQKRTNEPTRLSDTVNVRERKQRTMWTWTSDTKSMTSLLNVTRYITYNIHSYELFMGKVIQSILLHLFVLWITCHLLLIFQLDLWTDPHKFSFHIHLTYADCIQ